MCLCVCECVLHVWTRLHMSMSCLSLLFSTLVFDTTVSHWAWSSLIWCCCLASELLSPFPGVPQLEFQLGTGFYILMGQTQVLYQLSHLPGPGPFSCLSCYRLFYEKLDVPLCIRKRWEYLLGDIVLPIYTISLAWHVTSSSNMMHMSACHLQASPCKRATRLLWAWDIWRRPLRKCLWLTPCHCCCWPP